MTEPTKEITPRDTAADDAAMASIAREAGQFQPTSTHFLGRTLEQAAVFAKLMYQAGVGGKDCKGPQEILARIMAGLELGLAPMTAIRELYVVDGRVGMSSRLMHAQAHKHGVKLRFLATTPEEAKVEVELPTGERSTWAWTTQDAANANLLGKFNWRAYKRQMLLSRAVSMALNYAAPWVLNGGMYSVEEIEDLATDLPEAETPKGRVQKAMDKFDEVFTKGALPAPAVSSAEEAPAPAAEPAAEPPKKRGRPRKTTASPAPAREPWDEPAEEEPAEPAAPALTPLDNGAAAMQAAFIEAAKAADVLVEGDGPARLFLNSAQAALCGLTRGEYFIHNLMAEDNAASILDRLRAIGEDRAAGGA